MQMPKTEALTSLFNAATLLWGVITVAAVVCSRPILHGWLHDPSLRFAFASFLLWFLAVVLQWRRFPNRWPVSKVLLVILASALLCLGIVGELKAFIYLASAILVSLPICGSFFKCLCFILLSSLWMPALAWLLTPYLGALLPWITFLIAMLLLIYSLVGRVIRYGAKTSHTAI